ncbi:hypothetical protein [Janthinobacterium sp. RB2R34]|uniref:hypothetical protein n=1 Tax=Janthinobacterium sp. RB2R34 TaxID=3424193 RepID=UPI003F24CBAC
MQKLPFTVLSLSRALNSCARITETYQSVVPLDAMMGNLQVPWQRMEDIEESA